MSAAYPLPPCLFSIHAGTVHSLRRLYLSVCAPRIRISLKNTSPPYSLYYYMFPLLWCFYQSRPEAVVSSSSATTSAPTMSTPGSPRVEIEPNVFLSYSAVCWIYCPCMLFFSVCLFSFINLMSCIYVPPLFFF